MKGKLFLTIWIYIVINSSVICQVRIIGTVTLDTTWQPIIYVSFIPSLYDMYKCSENMIIGHSEVDSMGDWILDLPSREEEYLVRIHVSKKGAPPASLIIGGSDENHAFIAVGLERKLILKPSEKGLFTNYNCPDSRLNNLMTEVEEVTNKWDNIDFNTSNPKDKMLLRKAKAVELISFADTTENILPAIYAGHMADAGFNKTEVYETMEKINIRMGNHAYLNAYPKSSKKSQQQILFLYFITGVLLLWGMYRIIKLLISNKKNKLFSSLSNREREVFELIKQGKSNKELAIELNVEISTIKSHVNSIFNKLDISSRKELDLYQ